MVLRLLRSMLGSTGGNNPPEVVSETVYNGYTIVAAPSEDSGGWRVAGRIVTEIAGESRSVSFVRADVYGSREVAAEMTTLKAQRLIDEQGRRLFDSGH